MQVQRERERERERERKREREPASRSHVLGSSGESGIEGEENANGGSTPKSPVMTRFVITDTHIHTHTQAYQCLCTTLDTDAQSKLPMLPVYYPNR